MQGDRGRIYFWSKLRHADLNSKEWVLGKRSLSLADPRVNTGSVFITCNYIGPEIENPIPLEGICIESCNVVISWSITVDRTDYESQRELLRDEKETMGM